MLPLLQLGFTLVSATAMIEQTVMVVCGKTRELVRLSTSIRQQNQLL